MKQPREKPSLWFTQGKITKIMIRKGLSGRSRLIDLKTTFNLTCS